MLSRFSLLAAAGLLSLGLVEISNAQDASPMPSSGESTSCEDVQPRDAAFFENIIGTPEAQTTNGDQEQLEADGTPTPFAMPEGDVADEETTAAISMLYEQLIACLNASDYLRAYALYTDDYLVRNLSEETISRLEATPVPTDDSTRSEFGGLLDARILDDGRIAALVTITNPQSGEVLIYSTIRDDDGRLRIDDEMVVESEGAATPTS